MRSLIAALALIVVVSPAWGAERGGRGAPAPTPPSAETLALYAEHCAACHGEQRLGGVGPALLPENLSRLRRPAAIEVIAKGREASQMEGFADRLSPAQIEALADYAYLPLSEIPVWDVAEIEGSHEILTPAEELADKPVHDSDLMNLFIVVETGDSHATILDGDRFEPIWRFQTDFALHGGAKYSPDGRYVYLGSRDGWVTKHDLWNLKSVARVRVGINTRNIAVSGDGKWVMAGNYLPHSLVVLHAEDLTPYRVIPVADRAGNTSRVSAVYAAPPRNSFVVALRDITEVWELSWDPDAEPIYGGFVHNRRPGQVEAVIEHEQPFGIRRIALDDYLDDFFFDPYYAEVIGAARNAKSGMVYNLDVAKKVADLELDSMPHLGSGIYWKLDGRMVMATPHIQGDVISVIDMQSWKTVKKIDILGPAFFMRSHQNTPYAWTEPFFGPHKDKIHIIDKRTLEIVRTLDPEPGKTVAHAEFTKDGGHVLISVLEDDGAILVFDAVTFEVVKRIPMRRPVGKYNVWNKITYSEGTSH